MKATFTLVTISYLPRAYTLATSFLEHNPGYTVFITVIDPINELVEPFKHDKIIFHSINEIKEDGISELKFHYNIAEISFATKSLFFLFLLDKHPEIEHLFYLDADGAVYHSFEHAERLFENYDFLLTPHFFNPVNDDKIPTELDILRTGLYNMGFTACRNNDNAKTILKWWKTRVLEFGYQNPDLAFPADQMWMNLTPVMFDKVGIISNKGYNFAYWNVHERSLSEINGKFFVNEKLPLVYVHFADYNPHKPETFSNPRVFNRIAPGEDLVVDKLSKSYSIRLLQNKFDEYLRIKSTFTISPGRQAWYRISKSKIKTRLFKDLLILTSSMFPKFLRRFMRNTSLFIIRNIK